MERVKTEGFLAGLVGYHLRRAQVRMFRDFLVSLSDLSISPGEFGLLALIEATPGLTQVDLSGASGVDRSSLVVVLDRLEGRGLIVRARSEHDRRANALWLTAAGRGLLHRAKPLILEHEDRMLADFSEAEKASLIRLLRKIPQTW